MASIARSHEPQLHPAIQHLAGEIVDVDSHEMTPVQFWSRQYGADEVVVDLADHFTAVHDGELINVPGFERDDRSIDVSNIWALKGGRAPGAVDPARRTEVMDAMGVRRQLVYSSGPGHFGLFLHSDPPKNGFYPASEGEARFLQGRRLLDAANSFAQRASTQSDRVRGVGYVYGQTVDELMSVTRRLLAGGIRSVTLAPAVLPGGVSPAHSDLDPFWSLLEENDVSASIHGVADQGFLATRGWGDAPFFQGYSIFHEFDFSPWALSTVHLPPQNFVATMVVGGVFERHPRLRFGAIELGAYWIGQLAFNLDLWHKQNNKLFTKIEVDSSKSTEEAQVESDIRVQRLPELPSFYINRNIRVSAFDFEHVDKYIEQYGLEDVYCFSSDYPHVEGGRNPMGVHAERLQRLGPDIIEKFFVTNGSWLLPG